MNKTVKKILKVTGIAIGIIIIAMLILPFALKGKMAEIVKREANGMLNARVEFSDLDIGLFRHFPKASINLANLSITGAGEFKNDTLVSAKEIDIVVNIMSIFGDSGYEVKHIILDTPRIKAVKLADGRVNWDIIKSDTTKMVEDTISSKSSFKLQLLKFSIEKGYISYIDDSLKTVFSAAGINLGLSGNMTEKKTAMELNCDIAALNTSIGEITYLKNAVFKAEINVDADFENNKYILQENTIAINAISLGIDGWVALPEDNVVDMDLKINSSEIGFKDILSLIPAIYKNSFSDLTATGEMQFSAAAKGKMGGDILPSFDINLIVKNGKMSYKGLPKSIDNINITAQATHPEGITDLAKIATALNFSIAGNPFSVSFNAVNPVSDMNFSAAAKGFINLGMIKEVYPLGDSIKVNGKMTVDIKFAGKMSDIEKERYENISGQGYLNIKEMVYISSGLPEVLVNNLGVTVSSRALTLNNLNAKIGESDISANGLLTHYIPYFMKGETLCGSLNISSNLLNLNQFIGSNTSSNTAVEKRALKADTLKSGGTIEVPKNLDLALKATLKKVIFQKININNLTGNITVKEGMAKMNQLKFNALGGSIVASGSYSTAVDKNSPAVTFNLDIMRGNFKTTFEELEMIQKLVPIFAKTGGTYSAEMKMKATLDSQMNPNLNTLTATGIIQSSEIKLSNIEAFNLIANNIKSDALRNISAVNIKIPFNITDGRVITSPFDLKVGGAVINLAGSTGLDQTIDYKTTIQMPEGSGVSQYVGKVSGTITGTFSKPIVKLDLKSLATEAIKNVVSTQVEKLTGIDKTEQIAAFRTEADKAANKLVEVAKTEGQKLVDKTSNPIAKIAAQAAARRLEFEAQKQADALRAKAEEQIKKIESE
ncbi:MAG: AsmA-like C-terminal region-containing protein [Bacteroidales bacterium]